MKNVTEDRGIKIDTKVLQMLEKAGSNAGSFRTLRQSYRLPLGIQTPARHRPGRQKKAAEPFPPTIHCKRLQAMPA